MFGISSDLLALSSLTLAISTRIMAFTLPERLTTAQAMSMLPSITPLPHLPPSPTAPMAASAIHRIQASNQAGQAALLRTKAQISPTIHPGQRSTTNGDRALTPPTRLELSIVARNTDVDMKRLKRCRLRRRRALNHTFLSLLPRQAWELRQMKRPLVEPSPCQTARSNPKPPLSSAG